MPPALAEASFAWLVDLDRFLRDAARSIMVLTFLFYILVPVGLGAVTVVRKGKAEVLGTLRQCREWLLVFTHILFTAISSLLAIVIAVITIQHLKTSLEMNYMALAAAASGQQGAPTDRVLSLAEVMYGFFGLVLSLITVVGVVFSWWLRKNVESAVMRADSAVEQNNSLQEQIKNDAATFRKALENNLEFAKSSAILAADIALIQIPDVTFSQQIPGSLVGSFRVLEPIWSDENYWKIILQSDNGVRLRYARALYIMGSSLDWQNHVIDQPATPHAKQSGETSVVGLLSDARKSSRDSLLTRSILIRLFQVYRQADLFHNAAKVLDELKALQERGVFNWGKVVLHLQQGLNEGQDLKRRQSEFALAATFASSLFKEMKDFPTRDTAAIYYYCAKAFWSYRFSSGLSLTESPATPDKWREIGLYFEQAAHEAAKQLDQALSSGIPDNLTRVIYLVSKAYLLVAWKAYPATVEPPNTPPWNDPLALLTQAKSLLDRRLDDPVYNDHSERLGTLSDFQTYRNEVEGFAKDDEALWRFYELR